MRSRVTRALVALVLSLAIPLPALAACGSALLESSSHRMCRLMMMASGHCEQQAGMSADCCKVDDHTARHQVAQAIAPAPGKPALASLPANAQPDFHLRSSSGRALWTPSLDPPLDVSQPRSVVLLI